MQTINEKTIKLLSRSGLVLIFLSMIGSFAMAATSASGNLKGQRWEEIFGTLFLAIMGIAVYYMALSLFGWIVIKGRPSAKET